MEDSESKMLTANLEALEQEPALAVSHVRIFAEWFVEKDEACITADLRPPAVTMTTVQLVKE